MFDESANAQKNLTDALAAAQHDNRRVLLLWGSNVCDACIRLRDLMSSDPALRRILLCEYQVVLVDVGEMDHNLDLASACGAPVETGGVPWLTLLKPDGQPAANTSAIRFGDGHGNFDASKLLTFLRGYQPMYPSADGLLNRGLQTARDTNRLVLLQFTSPSSQRCVELEKWFTRPDVDSILSRALVRVRIDVDRSVGGSELLRRCSGDWETAPPWFVLIDHKNKIIARSVDAGGADFGALANDDGLARFAEILRARCRTISPKELDGLLASLREENQKPPAQAAAD